MRLRIVGVFACAAALLASTASLVAERDVPLACCTVLGDCSGRQCCDFDPTIVPVCSDDNTGYCMSVCIWPATRVSETQ